MRSNCSVKRVVVASLLVVAAAVALTSGVAASPVDHCNAGNVESAFQAWAPGEKLYGRLGLDHGGLAEGVGPCQYRLFAGAYGIDEACFCEDDYFLGGTTVYARLGEPNNMSPSEARDWLNQWQFEVFLTPEGGESYQLDVMGTAVKGGQHDRFGRVSWQQHGVFLQLPPGNYLSTYRDCHPDFGSCEPGGDGWWETSMWVRILPHDLAEELGPSTEPYRGSVQCPEE